VKDGRRCLAIVSLWLGACAPSYGSTYDKAYATAERAESAGRLAQALEAYDHAAAVAKRRGDADQARWAAADVLVRQDRVGDAVARLDAMAADPRSDRQAEAAYRAADLRVGHGDADRGWHDMESVVRRFPAHADESAGGAKAGLDELGALEHDVGRTELAELIAFLSADHLQTLGDDRAARDAYVHIADRWPYPYGAFFDGALWRASLLDEKLGRAQAAADDLERMLAERETTTLLGSYERKHYVPAMLRLGELYRDRLHDHAKARATFHRLYTDFRHSSRRDDALWLEASLWKEDGDATTACSRLATLVHDFPDSRYVPCATEQCPGVERPRESGAPKTCRAYIERAGWEPRPEQ
jgi:tetratricopeptide (TPR) repeat protein